MRIPSFRAACLLGLVAGFAGCGEREAEPELHEQQGLSVSIEALGRLGGEIYNEPERAEEILDEADMTPQEFEERVRRITNDPVLAREYSRGFEAVARSPRPEPTDTSAATGAAPAADTGGAEPPGAGGASGEG